MCQLQDHRKAESSLIRNSKSEESSEISKMQRAGAGGDHYSVMEYEAAGK